MIARTNQNALYGLPPSPIRPQSFHGPIDQLYAFVEDDDQSSEHADQFQIESPMRDESIAGRNGPGIGLRSSIGRQQNPNTTSGNQSPASKHTRGEELIEIERLRKEVAKLRSRLSAIEQEKRALSDGNRAVQTEIARLTQENEELSMARAEAEVKLSDLSAAALHRVDQDFNQRLAKEKLRLEVELKQVKATLRDTQMGEKMLEQNLKRTLGKLEYAEAASNAAESSRKRRRRDSAAATSPQAIRRPRDEDIISID